MTTTTEQGHRTAHARRAACVHHWVIDAPVDMTSRGRCVLCGAEREFSNRYVEPEPGTVQRSAFPRERRERVYDGA